MYNVFYEIKAVNSLKTFIDSYKNSFIRMIKDSWLDVEDYLIENYIKIWDKLYETIITEIKKNFKEDLLLWRNKDNFLIINVNNFRIFVYYDENNELKERYIIDIEFFRK